VKIPSAAILWNESKHNILAYQGKAKRTRIALQQSVSEPEYYSCRIPRPTKTKYHVGSNPVTKIDH